MNQACFLPHPTTNLILRTLLPFLKAWHPLPFVSAVVSEGTEQLPAQPSNPATQNGLSSFPGRTTTSNPIMAPTSASTSTSGMLAWCSSQITMVPIHAPSAVMLAMAWTSAPETRLLTSCTYTPCLMTHEHGWPLFPQPIYVKILDRKCFSLCKEGLKHESKFLSSFTAWEI